MSIRYKDFYKFNEMKLKDFNDEIKFTQMVMLWYDNNIIGTDVERDADIIVEHYQKQRKDNHLKPLKRDRIEKFKFWIKYCINKEKEDGFILQ